MTSRVVRGGGVICEGQWRQEPDKEHPRDQGATGKEPALPGWAAQPSVQIGDLPSRTSGSCPIYVVSYYRDNSVGPYTRHVGESNPVANLLGFLLNR